MFYSVRSVDSFGIIYSAVGVGGGVGGRGEEILCTKYRMNNYMYNYTIIIVRNLV